MLFLLCLIECKDGELRMLRNAVIIIIATLILSACSGGLSGIMSSSGFGHWIIYKVNYQADIENKFSQPFEEILEDMLGNLGFEKKYDWGSPLLTKSRVAAFKQKYSDRNMNIDVEISRKKIILMSTSYSNETKDIFNNIELALNILFTEAYVEKCFSTKDINGHSCLL